MSDTMQQSDYDRLMWNALDQTEPFGIEAIAKTYEMRAAHTMLQSLVREGHLRIVAIGRHQQNRRAIRYEWVND